jgi:predicted RNA-binding Zn-ribbon protein involved in translation (DUF1610 family)
VTLLRDIREVFRGLRHRKLVRMYCPKCGSPQIRLSNSMNYWLTPAKYLCHACGYSGPIIMELEKEEAQKRQ